MQCLGEHLVFLSVMPLFIKLAGSDLTFFFPEVSYFNGFVFEIKF